MNSAVLLGVGAAFAGAAVMTLQPGLSGEWPACAVAVTASVCWAVGTVLVRRLPTVHPLAIQGYGALFSAPLLLGGSFAVEPHAITAAAHAPALAWAAIAFGAIASTLGASALLFWLLQRHETGRVTGYLLGTPLITCVLGVALFGDVLTPRLIFGGLMTMVGVGLVAMAERRRLRLAAQLAS
jgi:O-acetylserine/cysteine efflux transporter